MIGTCRLQCNLICCLSRSDLASGTQAGLGFGRDVGRPRPPLPSTDFGPVLAGSLPLIQIPVFVPGLPSVEDACAPVKRRPDQEPSQE